MKNLIAYVALFGAINSAQADNTLLLSEGINLLAVNGKVVTNAGSFISNSNSHQLPNGNNQLLVSYTAEIKKGSTTELETSHPAVVTFNSVESTLTLSAPKISNQTSMRKFNQRLNWNLKKNGNKDQKYKTALLPLKGFRLGIDYTEELRKFNISSSEASLKLKESLIPENSTDITRDSSNLSDAKTIEQEVILNMLKHWYQLATPSTREQLLNEINSN